MNKTRETCFGKGFHKKNQCKKHIPSYSKTIKNNTTNKKQQSYTKKTSRTCLRNVREHSWIIPRHVRTISGHCLGHVPFSQFFVAFLFFLLFCNVWENLKICCWDVWHLFEAFWYFFEMFWDSARKSKIEWKWRFKTFQVWKSYQIFIDLIKIVFITLRAISLRILLIYTGYYKRRTVVQVLSNEFPKRSWANDSRTCPDNSLHCPRQLL